VASLATAGVEPQHRPEALKAQPGLTSGILLMGPSLDVRRTEAPGPDYRGTGGPLSVEPALDPNPVEPAMVDAVLRKSAWLSRSS
jgi:hypothetical protein